MRNGYGITTAQVIVDAGRRKDAVRQLEDVSAALRLSPPTLNSQGHIEVRRSWKATRPGENEGFEQDAQLRKDLLSAVPGCSLRTLMFVSG